jgi:hypothetical protein
VHALIFTAVLSRHMFVHLSYSQTLTEVIAGCEAAWVFFGGVFKVLIPDNLKPVVTDADAVNPRLSVGWLDYSQHAGFVTDTARVRSPQDKPKVERVVQYVRGNFFAGETFNTLQAAQHAATAWCTRTAGMRIHGTIAARPLEVFNQLEAVALLPIQPVYDVPILRSVKVHRHYHIEIGKALYSVPGDYIGQQLDARADSQLVKLFHRGQLVKTHPRQPAGGRCTDPADLPVERVGYAMRDLDRLRAGYRTGYAHKYNVSYRAIAIQQESGGRCCRHWRHSKLFADNDINKSGFLCLHRYTPQHIRLRIVGTLVRPWLNKHRHDRRKFFLKNRYKADGRLIFHGRAATLGIGEDTQSSPRFRLEC